MGRIADAFRHAWRDFKSDGIPGSGRHDPAKLDIRKIGSLIDEDISAETSARLAGDQAEAQARQQAVGAIQTELAGVRQIAETGMKPMRASVRLLATANVNIGTLNNGSTLDGETLVTGDRVALVGQSSAAQNGIYVIPSSGAATRAGDAATTDDLLGARFEVEAGTHAGETWALQTLSPITVGTTPLVFVRSNSAQPTTAEVVRARGEFTSLPDHVGATQVVGRKGAFQAPATVGIATRTYVFAEPVVRRSIVAALTVFGVSEGTIFVKAFTRAGNVMSQVTPDIPVQIVEGYQRIVFPVPVVVEAGWYLGIFGNPFVGATAGITGDSYYRSASGSGNVTSFTAATAVSSGSILLGFEVQAGEAEVFGRPYDAEDGSGLGDRTYVFADAAENDTELIGMRLYNRAAGTAYVSTWEQFADDLHQVTRTPVDLKEGYNELTFSPSIRLRAGQRIGIYRGTASPAVTAGVGADGSGYFDSGADTGELDSFPMGNPATAHRLNFGFLCRRRSIAERVQLLEDSWADDGGGGVPEPVALPSEYTVFLVGPAQSNLDGRGTGGPAVPAGIGYMWKTADGGHLLPMADPTGNTGLSAGSPWPAFAIEYHRCTGRGCVIVNMAVGGSSLITQWGSGGTARANAIAALNDCFVALDTAGIAWNFGGCFLGIGETDADAIDAETRTIGAYNAAFADALAFFRSQTSRPKMPMIICQTGQRSDGDTPGYQQVRAAQLGFVQDDDYVFLGSSAAKTFAVRDMMPDAYHYTQLGYNEIGRALANVAARVSVAAA